MSRQASIKILNDLYGLREGPGQSVMLSVIEDLGFDAFTDEALEEMARVQEDMENAPMPSSSF